MVHYSCEICSYNTNLKGNYSRHLKTKKCIQNTKEKEEQKETVFICSGCNRSFRDDFNLQRHRQKKIPCISSNLIQIDNQLLQDLLNKLNIINK